MHFDLCLSEARSLAGEPAPSDETAKERLEALDKLRQEELKAAEERYNVKVEFEADHIPLIPTSIPRQKI